MNKKIAYSFHTFTTQSYGGISRYYSNIIKEFCKTENQIKIFSPIYKNNYIKNLDKSIIGGLYVKQYPPKTQKIISQFNHTVSSIVINNWRPDIIHETYYYSGKIGNKCNARITTVHDMVHELFPDNYKKRDNTSILKQKSVDRADHVICISHNTKKDLINLFNTPEEKITVVHSGVDSYENKHIKKRNFVNKPYLLYVGKRLGYKNFYNFLKAYSESTILKKDINIMAFGGGDFTKVELNMINKMDLSDQNVFHISGNDAALRDAYVNALAFIYPSLYEGFGLPPLEAMSYGCPVISSNTSSLPEIISDAGVYFNPESIEDIRYSIENTVYNTNIIESLVSKGYKRSKELTWDRCAKNTFKVYSKFL